MIRLAPIVFLGVSCCLIPLDQARAARPSETLLPATTKGFVSVPDVDALRERWDSTDLGRLVNDPIMQPFVEDLRKQLEDKLALGGQETGITWDDLKDVYGGETAAAVIQPGGNPSQHAFVLLCDVTDHLTEARALLDKVSAHLRRQGATMKSQTAAGVPLLVFTLPKKANRPAGQVAVFGIVESQLIVSDNLQEAINLLGRFQGQPNDTLAQVPAFRAAMERAAREVGDTQPQLRWFVEPFGMLEVARSTQTEERRRGVDYLKIFGNQGFDAVQGMGGYVQIKTGEYEFLHHTLIYVPTPQGAGPVVTARNFKEAARMLEFPNAALESPTWLPRELATVVNYNWKMKEAFEFSKTLVNEVAGDPIFEDVIQSFRDDPLGPQIDLRKDLIAHLGTKITVASDYRLPITPESERLMVAIELTNPRAVATALNKAMARDPDVRKIPFGDHIIWEILDPSAEEDVATITLKIDGPAFGPLDVALQDDEDEEEKPVFPNSAVTVAYGRLIWTSQVDFAKDLLAPRAAADTLRESVDYQTVNAALDKLGAGQDSFRYFSRPDEAMRPTYELMQQGKMPEAKTLLGRVLNALFADEEDELLRKQEIDAHTLPDYQVVRRHLGPGGVYVRTEQNGWFAVGCGLSKQSE